jgi:sporulation protein YlmC with PRC-barrel domain
LSANGHWNQVNRGPFSQQWFLKEEMLPKSALTAVFAVIMATAPLAYAQTMAPSQGTIQPADRSTPSAFTTGSGELRASELIGSTVYDVQNQNIGSVKDVIVNPNGRVSAIVIDVGAFLGIGGKNVAVALNDIKTDNDRLTLDRSKDQLKSAEPYHFGTSNQ